MRAVIFSLFCVLPLLVFSHAKECNFVSTFEQWIDRENNFVEYCDEIDAARVISIGSAAPSCEGEEVRPTSSESMSEALFLSYLNDDQEMFDKFLRYILFTAEKSGNEHTFRMPSFVDENGDSFWYLSPKELEIAENMNVPFLDDDLLISVSLHLAGKKVVEEQWEDHTFSTSLGELDYQQICEKMDLDLEEEEEEFFEEDMSTTEEFQINCKFVNDSPCDLCIKMMHGNGTFECAELDLESEGSMKNFSIPAEETADLLFTSGNEYYGTFSFQYWCEDKEYDLVEGGWLYVSSSNGVQWYVHFDDQEQKKNLYKEDLIFYLGMNEDDELDLELQSDHTRVSSKKKQLSEQKLKSAWKKILQEMCTNLECNEENENHFTTNPLTIYYPIVQFQPSDRDSLDNTYPCEYAIYTLLNRAIAEERFTPEIFQAIE